jgi:hypothetical protein
LIYCYPRFSRLDFLVFRVLGPGLGNLLFPWARAVVAASRPGFRLVNPTWPQWKLGRLARLDSDLRSYAGMFQAPGDALTGAARLRALLGARRVTEAGLARAGDGDLVIFEGMASMFAGLLPSRALLHDTLVASTRHDGRPTLAPCWGREIVVHVRLGDFAPASAAELEAGRNNARLPIAWYAAAVRGVRKGLGAEIPVHVFSDGRPEELRELLALPACRLEQGGNAIADLIALARGGLLVASGSTFSMWAAFLGQMPSVWHPGQRLQALNERPALETELAEDGGFSSEFLEAAAARLLPQRRLAGTEAGAL